MKTIPNIKSSALISLIISLPFMILELVNRRNFNQGFPVPLFIILWLLPMAFILTLMPIVQNIRVGNSLMANPIKLILSITALLISAILWAGILTDQMPCFIGIPNCD